MSALRHVLRSRASLTDSERARMLSLMQLCYDNVDPARFRSDLENKRDVIVLVDGDGTIMGFSTVRIAEEMLDGRRVDILFSGDTVIHPDCWGAKALQWGFLAYTLRHKLRRPWRPLYWLLLSKGYKTYLLLTNNFPTAFPRRAHAAPDSLVALRNKVATDWWGSEYDASTEILTWADARDRVRSGVAALDAQTLAHPDIAWFVEKNPRWSEGQELVCFAEIDFALGARWIAKTVRRMGGKKRARTLERPAE
jgi:hypothetical protein